MSYCPPLHIHVVYETSNSMAKELAQSVVKWFAGDPDNLGAPEARIPVFVWNGTGGTLPPYLDCVSSDRFVILAMVDDVMVSDRVWQSWWAAQLSLQADKTKCRFIPCALTSHFANLGEDIARYHAVRFDKMPAKGNTDQFLLEITHHIGRWYQSDPITLFLSHAKRPVDGISGEHLAETIRDFVNRRPVGDVFFDHTKLSAGENFEIALQDAICKSIVVILRTDLFSSRYWCAWEAHQAKKFERPMLVVDTLCRGEPSSLPSLGRVRTIRWDVTTKRQRQDKAKLQTIAAAALLEVLRNAHDQARLRAIGAAVGIVGSVKHLIRPPEPLLHDLSQFGTVLYPDPPVPRFEHESFHQMFPHTRVLTGAQALAGNGVIDKTLWLKGIRVALSVSAKEDAPGIPDGSLFRLLGDIVGHLMQAGAQLAYGGDLRQNGYTVHLNDLAKSAADSANPFPTASIHWYMAWPLGSMIDAKTKASLRPAFEFHELPEPYPGAASPAQSPSEDTTEQQLARVLALTQMRKQMAKDCHARIFVSGQLQGVSPWPGLLEELELFDDKPVFFIGSYGGMTRAIFDAFNAADSTRLDVCVNGAAMAKTSDFDKLYDSQTKSVLDARPRSGIVPALRKRVTGGFSGLDNGLTEAENRRLGETKDPTEITALILRGLAKCFS